LVNGIAGFNFEGGHPAFEGIDTAGMVISVPEFSHAVSLDYQRYEIELRYSLADHWAAWLRIPYEVKDQSVEIVVDTSATPEEQAAMLRNGEIHHRDEAYKNVTDLNLLIAHQKYNWLSDGDFLVVSAGTSLPTGKTEDDPFTLAVLGEEHLHIQFGTGTFDALLELNYLRPVGTRTFIGTFVAGRYPFYTNSKGYKGPPEFTAALNGRYRVSKRMSLKARSIFFLQGYGRWSGERDVNSGLVSVAGGLGASFNLGANMSIGADLRLPVYQALLSGSGDSFELGPMISVNLSISQN
jgi:hypothetical protein